MDPTSNWELAYATESREEYADAIRILGEDRVRRVAPEGAQGEPPADPESRAILAAKRAASAHRLPAFVISKSILLSDITIAVDNYICAAFASLLDPTFCRRYGDQEGVLHQVLCYCSSPVSQPVVFHRYVPGRVARAPKGEHGTPLERLWIPHGYSRTLAELRPYRKLINKRHSLYVDLAGHLELPITDTIYEAHVTVDSAGVSFERFSSICNNLGVKAINILLPAGATTSHFITASLHLGKLDDVNGEVENLALQLKQYGLAVQRLKIESMITNRAVPTTAEDAATRPASQYFEFHVKVALETGADLAQLANVCATFDAHLSTNPSNRLGSQQEHFVTLRVYRKPRAAGAEVFDQLIAALQTKNYRLSNILKEYTVHDSRPSLDDGWFGGSIAESYER